MLKIEENLFEWAKSQIPDLGDITLLREQASSRKYYRVSSGDKTFVLAASDPQMEKNDEFIKYSDFLLKNNVSVPKIEAFDLKNGFMIMKDFGDQGISI
jgi:Predicted phosphotransferase related to Ser/Thr protein kinases